jgi:hypothetical protein
MAASTSSTNPTRGERDDGSPQRSIPATRRTTMAGDRGMVPRHASGSWEARYVAADRRKRSLYRRRAPRLRPQSRPRWRPRTQGSAPACRMSRGTPPALRGDRAPRGRRRSVRRVADPRADVGRDDGELLWPRAARDAPTSAEPHGCAARRGPRDLTVVFRVVWPSTTKALGTYPRACFVLERLAPAVGFEPTTK